MYPGVPWLDTQFEWQPDLEGVKTNWADMVIHPITFEWQPDLEGVKTPHKGSVSLALAV